MANAYLITYSSVNNLGVPEATTALYLPDQQTIVDKGRLFTTGKNKLVQDSGGREYSILTGPLSGIVYDARLEQLMPYYKPTEVQIPDLAIIWAQNLHRQENLPNMPKELSDLLQEK